MNGHGNVTADLSWLLDDVVNRVVGAQSAVVLSADGLQIGKSAGVSKDDSDQLSAIASSLQSLAKGVSRQFSRGDVVQNMIEMERGYLFVLAAGRGACLALLADDRVDVVAVAYEMNRLVKRVGDYLAAAPRNVGHLLPEAP
jgi:predicted regulator of Ras-like GTPase activity (Roadblock/LC7/MglB family)